MRSRLTQRHQPKHLKSKETLSQQVGTAPPLVEHCNCRLGVALISGHNGNQSDKSNA